MSKSEQIFNKYARQYFQKYSNVDRYSESLDFFLKNLKSGSKVLEVACGPGNITAYLLSKRSDLRIIGLDLSKNMIELARKNQPAAEFLKMDCREIYRLDQKFDALIAGFYLPYLNKKETYSFIQDSARLLNQGGTFYISLMEDDHDNSGYVGSSEDKEEKLFTYYHEKDYLLDYLKENDLELLFSERIENENNKQSVKDLILISRKLNG